jgi:hypothetical protein
MNINKLELFLTISGGVIYWQTPGLIGHKGLMDTIDRPFQYCLDLNNQGRFAAFNHHIKGEHYVSVTCAMFRTDDRGRPNAPYRFHAILPWAIYQEKLGTDAFALARWAFSKEVLGRIYGNTQSETEGELFSPQVYQNFPPQIEAKRRPDITFMLKHWDEQQLKLFIGALLAGVAPPLRFRDDGNVAQWSPNQHWSDRKPTDGERLLEELYLCLPDETRAWCNISTAWNRCDQFPFHLALDSRSSENAQAALTQVVGSMTEEARRKAQVVIKQYVAPLFQAIADKNDKRINQLHRVFTIKSISWPSEPKTVDGESSVTDHNNRLQTMAKHPFVIGAMGIALVVGFGIGGWLFSSKGELKETNVHIKQERDALQNGLNPAKSESELAELLTAERKNSHQLKQQVSELSTKWIEEQNKYSELEKQLKAEQEKSSDLARQLSAEQENSRQLEQQVSELSTKLIEEQHKYGELKKQLKVEQEKFGKLKKQLETEQNKSSNLKQRVSKLSTNLIEKQNRYSELEKQLKAEQERSGELEKKLETKQNESTDLKQQVDKLSEKVNKLSEKETQERRKSDELKKTLKVEREKSSNLASQLRKKYCQLAQQASNTIVINEIAWMGTSENTLDEWIELYNYGDNDINLDGWNLIISEKNSKKENPLSGNLKKGGFWVLKRKDNKNKKTTILKWDATFDGILWGGEHETSLVLKYRSNEVDRVDKVDKWYAGTESEAQQGNTQDNTRTMERKNPCCGGNDKDNWCDATAPYNENYPDDKGTPGRKNSCVAVPEKDESSPSESSASGIQSDNAAPNEDENSYSQSNTSGIQDNGNSNDTGSDR